MTQEDSVLLEGEHAMELAYWEEEVIEALGVGLTDYLGKCSFEQVVLGLSGGIDSAVVAMLATHAGHPCSRHSAGQWHCDALSISSQGAFDDACALAASLNTKPDTLPIEPLIVAYEVALSECFAGLLPNLTKENLQSQIWGILWMAYSNKFGSLLLMTDNKESHSKEYPHQSPAELRVDQKYSDSLPPYDLLDAILGGYMDKAHSIHNIKS
ncbi:related to trna methyltransferase [Sporisorium scitamineum]|uniref:Related to trna methyltransferase n=1 Tax=Sporisorium scitamineum TaxID=49012 RepID=A0A127Z3B8_9BASI|nr:related to trna methyltransferase [Sporisorium scitamineum]